MKIRGDLFHVENSIYSMTQTKYIQHWASHPKITDAHENHKLAKDGVCTFWKQMNDRFGAQIQLSAFMRYSEYQKWTFINVCYTRFNSSK